MSRLNSLSNRFVQPLQLRENWTATISDHVIDLAWSPDGRYIAAASVLGPVTIFEGRRRAVIHAFKGHEFGAMSIAWRPDSKVLASAGQDGKIRWWEITTGKATHSLDGGAAWVEHLAWSGGKKPMLASAAGRNLKLWNAAGDLVREYRGGQSTISGLQWKPHVNQLASIAYGGVMLWDPQHSEAVRRLEWIGSSLVIAWSPDGKYIATGDQDSTVHFWIVSTGDDLQMSGYPTKVRELSWDATSRYLATGGSQEVTVWDCSGRGPAGSRPITLSGHQDFLSVVRFQHHGKLLASGGADGRVFVWQLRGRLRSRPVHEAALTAGITSLVWSPNDQFIAVGDETGQVSVFSIS
ncbi:MAG: WD40 repeat domain-containing protein [Candidatus Poribacteria bacterium]|nr:WD40 repeat domain-containing protein [Candidatus Poribacteria bacterium]